MTDTAPAPTPTRPFADGEVPATGTYAIALAASGERLSNTPDGHLLNAAPGEVPDAQAALAGARDIVAEVVA